MQCQNDEVTTECGILSNLSVRGGVETFRSLCLFNLIGKLALSKSQPYAGSRYRCDAEGFIAVGLLYHYKRLRSFN